MAKSESKQSYIRNVQGGANIPAAVLNVLYQASIARRKLITGPMAFATFGKAGTYFIDNSLAYISPQLAYIWRPTTEVIKFEHPCVEVNFSDEFLRSCAPPKPVMAISEGDTYEMPQPGWTVPENVYIWRTSALLMAKEKWPELNDDDDWTILASDSSGLSSDSGWDYSQFFLAGHPDRAKSIRAAMDLLEGRSLKSLERFQWSGMCLNALGELMKLGVVETILRDKSLEFRSENYGSIYVPITPKGAPNE